MEELSSLTQAAAKSQTPWRRSRRGGRPDCSPRLPKCRLPLGPTRTSALCGERSGWTCTQSRFVAFYPDCCRMWDFFLFAFACFYILIRPMLVGTSNEKHLFLKGPKGKSQVHRCHFHFLAKVRKHNKINTHGMKIQHFLTKVFSRRDVDKLPKPRTVDVVWKIVLGSY